MSASFDTQMMARALGLARRGVYSTRPNPAVGCVLVRDGVVIGEGFTQPAGGNHAEIEALLSCTGSGTASGLERAISGQEGAISDPEKALSGLEGAFSGVVNGATAYVTLEPCSHQGKTGPCAEALIAAGIARCVIAMRDPNPAVAGEGVAKLAAAGIAVTEGVLAGEAERINPGFYQRMRTGLPFVRLKLAASLDGRTAMASGESQWITGAAARADVQKLRARSGAIVTGVQTVLADDPALTVRDESLAIPGQPLRVILDSQLRTPLTAQTLQLPGQVLVAYANPAADPRPLTATGAELVLLGADQGRVDLGELLSLLGGRQVNDILVECGPRLAGAFVAAGLVDELLLYVAPTLLGSAAQPLLDLPIDVMADQRRLTVLDVRQLGSDFRYTLGLAC